MWHQAVVRSPGLLKCLALSGLALAVIGDRSAHAAQAAQPPPAADGAAMAEVGKSFLFDYGELVIGVRYLSDRRLAWEQVKGPDAGLAAEETYGFRTIRPGVYFVWWQEKDTSVVTQVVDFERGVVHTTWISANKNVAAFTGKIRPR
jgi:hypothetical protein